MCSIMGTLCDFSPHECLPEINVNSVHFYGSCYIDPLKCGSCGEWALKTYIIIFMHMNNHSRHINTHTHTSQVIDIISSIGNNQVSKWKKHMSMFILYMYVHAPSSPRYAFQFRLSKTTTSAHIYQCDPHKLNNCTVQTEATPT